jgi:hypothetical protein
MVRGRVTYAGQVVLVVIGMILLGPVGGVLLIGGIYWAMLEWDWIGAMLVIFIPLLIALCYVWFLGSWLRALFRGDSVTAPPPYPRTDSPADSWVNPNSTRYRS